MGFTPGADAKKLAELAGHARARNVGREGAKCKCQEPIAKVGAGEKCTRRHEAWGEFGVRARSAAFGEVADFQPPITPLQSGAARRTKVNPSRGRDGGQRGV